MADIRKRKKKLEDDLELLETDFEIRFNNVQKKVLGTLQPVSYVKNNPLKAVGASILIGFVIGLARDGKSSQKYDSGRMHKEKLLPLLFNEAKRVAARRVISYMSDAIDQKLYGNK